jgi:hypothetical protein
MRLLTMSTGETNKLSLAPAAVAVRPLFFTAVILPGFAGDHMRSRPAELDSTYRRPFAKPVNPMERPTDLTTSAVPLEPAQEPVPGAIPA